MTTETQLTELLKNIYEGWEEVKQYDDNHTHYDRHSEIVKMINKKWVDSPDETDYDTDIFTVSILIEQLLRYGGIVKETRFGLVPKRDLKESIKRMS